MKIIDLSTFTSNHSGGKDEVAYNLLKGFSNLGCANEFIVVVRPGVDKIVQKIDADYKTVTVNRWVNLSKPGLVLGVLSDLFYGLKLKKLVKANNVNCILYTNKFIPNIRICEKIIMIPHDVQCLRNIKELKMNSVFDFIQCILINLNFRVCDHIIAISDYDRDEMVKYLPQYSRKIRRIYDPIIFKPTQLDGEKLYITALNIQWAHKNVITLIRAYARIADTIKEDLILVGKTAFSDSLKAEIDEVIATNNLYKRIHFTGFVSSEELNNIIAKTRIYVNTSLFEGFGMTAVEMMGSCIPTIVNTDTALPESTMGLCRYYEPACDYNALANQMLEELRNPTSSANLEEISDKIKNNYDYIKISREYLNLLGE